MQDTARMISNPEEYGFEWGYGPLHKDKTLLCEAAPYIVHKDLSRMREVFGDEYFLDSANGQSARVRDQTLRNDLWTDATLKGKPEEMKRIVLERALGTRARRRSVTVVTQTIVQKVYVADDGSEFTDKAEYLAKQAELKYAL